MSNYTQTTFFAPKDALLSGNPAKIIYGAQVDPELNAIAVAIATKYDSASIASGPILFAAGSASLPSISFTGGTNNNTGIYLFGANQLGFAVAGVNAGSITAGAWNIPAPTSGVGLTVNGLANQYAGTFISSSTSGQGFGLKVQGGTTSADIAFGVTNQSASAGFFAAYGNGEVVVATPLAGAVTGGTIGSSTVYQVGYLDMPLNSQTAGSGYQLVLGDRGKMVRISGATITTLLIPANAGTAFPVGTTIMARNAETGSISLSITTDTLTWVPSGSTGTRTLAAGAVVTLYKNTATSWEVWGTGIT